MYALGWCASACLVYASQMYLQRDNACKTMGEPIQDDWDERPGPHGEKEPEHYSGPATSDEYVLNKGGAQEMQLGQLFGRAGHPHSVNIPFYPPRPQPTYNGFNVPLSEAHSGQPMEIPQGPYSNPAYVSTIMRNENPNLGSLGRFGSSLPRVQYGSSPNQLY